MPARRPKMTTEEWANMAQSAARAADRISVEDPALSNTLSRCAAACRAHSSLLEDELHAAAVLKRRRAQAVASRKRTMGGPAAKRGTT